jgi:hypothetical protein
MDFQDTTGSKDDTDSQADEPEAKGSESEVETTQTTGDWNNMLDNTKPSALVIDIASELISSWSSLKVCSFKCGNCRDQSV